MLALYKVIRDTAVLLLTAATYKYVYSMFTTVRIGCRAFVKPNRLITFHGWNLILYGAFAPNIGDAALLLGMCLLSRGQYTW